MAWSLTLRGSAGSNLSSADIVSDTFTPAANAIVLAFLNHNAGAGTVVGVSGHGTWEQIAFGLNEGIQGASFELWAALTGGSPSSGPITIDRNYQNKNMTVFIEIDETAGFAAAIADAFGAAAYDSAYGSDITLVATVAAFAQSTNMALGFGGQFSGTAGNLFDPESGYTKETEFDGGAYNGVVVWKTTEDTTISIISTEFNVHTALMGIEVKHAAGGASVVLVQEHVDLADAFTAVLTATATVSENVDLTDSNTAIFTAVAAISEAVDLGESWAVIAQVIAATSENVDLGDTWTTGGLIAASLSENVDLASTFANTVIAAASVSEQTDLTDLYGVVLTATASLSEPVDLASAYSALLQAGASISEAITLAATFAVSAGEIAAAVRILVEARNRRIIVEPRDRRIIVEGRKRHIDVKKLN